jgi:hypothetical protein
MVPYMDCWQDAVLSQPTWLKHHLEKACKVKVAMAAAASNTGKNVKSQKNSY